MADEVADGGGYETTFDPARGQPNVDVTETVAALKGVESDELSPLYDAVGHVVDDIFSEPPRSGSDVEVSFSYEGFRITISQDGDARFRPEE
ncbi:hypothetical protein OB920_14705 [Halobacteria archaeon HArc-gm2]|nr:hypothetical protein [Halobacteria archaeon HArc-gm2]